jgi:hypothetical protein
MLTYMPTHTHTYIHRFVRAFHRFRSRFRIELIQILQNSAAVSFVCCVFFDSCGNAGTHEGSGQGWTGVVCEYWLAARSARSHHGLYRALALEDPGTGVCVCVCVCVCVLCVVCVC